LIRSVRAWFGKTGVAAFGRKPENKERRPAETPLRNRYEPSLDWFIEISYLFSDATD
jgi:hypothetical protein